MPASLLKSSLMTAVLWMLVALLSFSVMAVAVRELAAQMHAFEMLFIRSLLGWGFLVVFILATGRKLVWSKRLVGHGLRNLVHFTGQTLWIYGIALLPLATVFAIEFTTPIWAAVLAVCFLGERMNRSRWVAFGCGFLGILVILRPGLEGLGGGIVVMVACAFFFGATTAFTKWLTRTESALAIVFYMTLIQAILGLVASLFVWRPITLDQWPWLVLLAITGMSAHYAIAKALSYADATVVMPIDFLRLPLIAFVGLVLYAEPLDWVTLAGACLIFAGNYYSLRREGRLAAGRGGSAVTY